MATDGKKTTAIVVGIIAFFILDRIIQTGIAAAVTPYTAAAMVLPGLANILLIVATVATVSRIFRSIDDNAVYQSALIAEDQTAAEEIEWEGKRYDAVKYVIARTQYYYKKIRNNGETEPLLKAVNEKYAGYPFKELDIRAINNAKVMYDEARKKKRAQQAEEEIQQDSENEGLRKAFGMYHDQEEQQ